MPTELSIKKIEEAIQASKPEAQKHLLTRLPHLLKISLFDISLLKVSEESFDFWNNEDDIIYDSK